MALQERQVFLAMLCACLLSCLAFGEFRSTRLVDVLGLQERLFSRLNDKLSLREMSFGEATKSWKEGNWEGKASWFEEQKGAKLTGVSKH